MQTKYPALPKSPSNSIYNPMPVPYPDLPASEYEYCPNEIIKKNQVHKVTNMSVPFPLELYVTGVLKVPTKELNSCTYVLTKNICGLHFVGNRLSIQTTIPCQGQLSNIMFICPTDTKQKVVEFILGIIDENATAS